MTKYPQPRPGSDTAISKPLCSPFDDHGCGIQDIEAIRRFARQGMGTDEMNPDPFSAPRRQPKLIAADSGICRNFQDVSEIASTLSSIWAD
jgi:hypothetical protein